MVLLLPLLLASLLILNTAEDLTKKLPECPYIDPMKDLEKWAQFDWTSCNISETRPAENGTAEAEHYETLLKNYFFNAYMSDKIGPDRSLEPITHPKCAEQKYDLRLRASIVIVYHNEALSALVRMLNGLLRETPPELLAEIILYDDFSEPHLAIGDMLEKYGKLKGWSAKIKYHKAEERQGLIRAKVIASQLAIGDVLIFLDSHCEVTPGWIQPLIAAIQEDRKRVVLPVVDIISPTTFKYEKAMIAKGSFEWDLIFKWEYLPWSYWDIEENNVSPIKTTAMSGGLLAVHKEYFREIGEYDTGMEIWGAENIEFSVRLWLCGGSIYIVPCSRVGHVFRMHRPYKGKPGLESSLFNSLRAAKVWFDDYEKHFLDARPHARRLDAGDLSDRLKLKQKLDCKPFSWFIENVEPKLRPLTEKTEL